MENPSEAGYFSNQELLFTPANIDWLLFQQQMSSAEEFGSQQYDAYAAAGPQGKRRFEDNWDPVAGSVEVKRKRANMASKNAFMYFSQAFPELVRQVTTEQIREEGRIAYVSSVTINGEPFSGKDRSKQLSKHAMARSVLARFFPEGQNSLIQSADEAASSFTTDEAEGPSQRQEPFKPEQSGVVQEAPPNKDSDLFQSTPVDLKPPCQLLLELCQRNANGSLPFFELTKLESGKIACKITIGEKTVEAVGNGRKSAKNLAADKALRELLSIEPFWLEKAESERNKAAIVGLTAQHALLKLCAQRDIPVKFAIEKSSDHPGQMKAVCQVGDQSFDATGSKRRVRTLVAMKALKEVFRVDYDINDATTPLVMPKDVLTKTPCQLLNEVLASQGLPPVEYTGFQVDLSGEGFRACAKFEDTEYTGCGPSKKRAKQEVAHSILFKAFNIYCPIDK